MVYTLDLIGTFSFAVSGTLSATNKKLDVFGASVIAFTTAIGGGTIRDIMIGDKPVHWITDLNYSYIIIAAVIFTCFFHAKIMLLKKTLFLFDTIGIGIFTIMGIQKSLSMGLHPFIAIMMGTVSAVFGGIIRDILCNEVPLILKKEFYASACILGGIIYCLLNKQIANEPILNILTILFIIFIRICAVTYKWGLPKFN